MNKRKTLILYILILIILIFLIIFVSWPDIYSFINGNNTIKNHIIKLDLTDKNTYEITNQLFNWLDNNVTEMWAITHSAPKPCPIKINNYCVISIYTIYDKEKNVNINKYYHRADAPRLIAWFIKSRMGACGEGTWYYVKVMDTLGYNAKTVKVKGGGHLWAELIDETGTKYYVDPFTNHFESDLNKFIFEITWVDWNDLNNIYIAQKINGKKEDITDEYTQLIKNCDLSIK